MREYFGFERMAHLAAIENPGEGFSGSLLEGGCSLRRAYESASADGFPFDGRTDMLLSASKTNGVPTWSIRTGDVSATLDGATCIVKINSAADRRR